MALIIKVTLHYVITTLFSCIANNPTSIVHSLFSISLETLDSFCKMQVVAAYAKIQFSDNFLSIWLLCTTDYVSFISTRFLPYP